MKTLFVPTEKEFCVLQYGGIQSNGAVQSSFARASIKNSYVFDNGRENSSRGLFVLAERIWEATSIVRVNEENLGRLFGEPRKEIDV